MDIKTFAEKYHPNKAQTSHNSIIWNDQTVSHFRNIPRRRQKQSSLDRFLVKVKPELTLNPPEGIIAGPTNEENFFEWEALIMGPEGTCFECGVFPAKLIFPPDYPLSPPKMQFTCEMFHPNIYSDGRVCISILHAPGDDPMGYETSAERWSPVQSVEKILLSVVSMLAEPNDESSANVDAAKMWRDDREQFNKIAERLVRKTLNLPYP
ncbi:ubiquitin-conjugating enzyme E2 G2 isoform X1 [Cherax quadricarinatus]|nr:ubiquitin-conjugating enzyme E2 G2 isoform X1 [Cherax quadricarinatus]